MAINHSATWDITHYMHQEFSSQTFPGLNAPKPDPPLYIPTHSIVTMNQIVASMHVAYNNRKQSSFNLIWLSECLSAMELGVDETQEAGHLAAHPSSLTGFVDEPMVILGTSDTIALWYLPSAITDDLQASLQTHMLATLDPLHHAMSKSMTSGSWQKNAEYFNHTSWSPGCQEFSQPGTNRGIWYGYITSGTMNFSPSVSTDLQMDAGHEWSQQSYLLAASSPDPHSWSDWYDMLVMVGDYEDCVLDIPMLGLQFLYNPGTVVAFSSRLLQHGGYPMGIG
ncbi:hypothetical protein F5J12DRAFT_786395 [Pisolithus orientalis]|uniref:uncharacterized protein n=1 Tax=Pisolithus orientalis TaxID=936130 RepID=UPI002225098B|nr:uncharacterized protein F5J12DRAFT_786395 [Pisolithus orientalis]KAI5991059.1 hypothetical protein F5J12DRAFT_786395 [Pisolithus orientalis]